MTQEGTKGHLTGTHRVRTPAETWEWIAPRLGDFGITRVADITWLDDLGIPVFQAIQPNGRRLSVYQGKGIDALSARVSAAMEAVERWHGERPPPPDRYATVAEMRSELGYSPWQLVLRTRHCLDDHTRLGWLPARQLRDNTASFVPADYVTLDMRVLPRWRVPVFHASANGLASGNTQAEATLHGLYEVVERDAVRRAEKAGPVGRIAPESVPGRAGELLEQLRTAEAQVDVFVLPSPTGVPCFGATVRNASFSVPATGYGCHLDRDVALCRAITEAAQLRASVIAGSRDDLIAGPDEGRGVSPAPFGPVPTLDLDEVPSLARPDLDADLADVVARVTSLTGCSPLAVDHTRPDLGVPAVHVVCPGLDLAQQI